MGDIVCKECGKKLGDWAKHGERAMKSRSRSWDMYYFCYDGECCDHYQKRYFDALDKGEEQ